MNAEQRKRAIHPMVVDEIIVDPGRRPLDDAAVERIAASIREIGLRTPITVKMEDRKDREDGIFYPTPVLVAGMHRLAAHQKLGLDRIDCVIMDGDKIDAEMWEIAENLHRADLTKEQRDEHIRRYVDLLKKRDGIEGADDKPRQNVVVSSGGRGNKGYATKAAVDLGLNVRRVQRVLNPKPAAQKPKLALVPSSSVPLSNEMTRDQWYDAIMPLWEKGLPEWRESFLVRIDADIPAFLKNRSSSL